MCLDIKKDQKPMIAENDIVVYKFVDRTNVKDTFFTHYQTTRVILGETYTSRILVDNYFNEINVGIHSCVNCKDARTIAKKLNLTVIKCSIPKGSTYYIGTFLSVICGRIDSIASNAIRYDKVIQHYKD